MSEKKTVGIIGAGNTGRSELLKRIAEDQTINIPKREPKCPTCGDSGIVTGKDQIINSKTIPCPDCTKPEEDSVPEHLKYIGETNPGGPTKPEQVEDIMDLVEPEEYLKPDERIQRWSIELGWKRERGTKFLNRFKDDLGEWIQYSDHKSALSASEKEIEELGTELDSTIEMRDKFGRDIDDLDIQIKDQQTVEHKLKETIEEWKDEYNRVDAEKVALLEGR